MHLRSLLNREVCGSSRRFVLVLSAVVSLTALLSILVLAFKADASSNYSDVTDNGGVFPIISFPLDGANSGLGLSPYPLYLDGGTVTPTLAGAGVSLGLSLGIGLLYIWVHRRAQALPLSKVQRLGMFLVLGSNCVLSLYVFITCSAQRFRSARFVPSYRSPLTYNETYGPDDMYDNGTFDLGSWCCQVNANGAVVDSGHILLRQCIEETASLWIGLLLVFLNLAMTGLVWMDWRGPRVLVCDYNDLVDKDEIDYIGEQDQYT